MRAPVAARSVVSIIVTASAGNPQPATASESTWAIATHERSASEPPRKMQALPVRMQMPAASEVTLGRAS